MADDDKKQYEKQERPENKWVRRLWNFARGGYVVPNLENWLNRWLRISPVGKEVKVTAQKYPDIVKSGGGLASAALRDYIRDPTVTSLTDVAGDLVEEFVRIISEQKPGEEGPELKPEDAGKIMTRLINLAADPPDLMRGLQFLQNLSDEECLRALKYINDLDDFAITRFLAYKNEAKRRIIMVADTQKRVDEEKKSQRREMSEREEEALGRLSDALEARRQRREEQRQQRRR